MSDIPATADGGLSLGGPALHGRMPGGGLFRRWILPFLLFATTLVLIASEHKEVFSRIKAADEAAASAIGSVSIAGLSDAFMKRFESCTYSNLVVCEPRAANSGCVEFASRPAMGGLSDAMLASAGFGPICKRWAEACDIVLLCPGTTEGPAILLAPIAGLQILPRLPDAIFAVLEERLTGGDTFGFLLMVLFVALSLFGIVGTIFGSGETNPLKWTFVAAASVVLSPLLVSLAFGAVQLALLALTGLVGLMLQALILAAGLLALLLFWLKTGHDAHGVIESARAIGRGE